MADSQITVKTRKFLRNPLLQRRQMVRGCIVHVIACGRAWQLRRLPANRVRQDRGVRAFVARAAAGRGHHPPQPAARQEGDHRCAVGQGTVGSITGRAAISRIAASRIRRLSVGSFVMPVDAFALLQMYKTDVKNVYVFGFKTPFGTCVRQRAKTRCCPLASLYRPFARHARVLSRWGRAPKFL